MRESPAHEPRGGSSPGPTLGGFSLIEAVVSLALLTLLVTIVFTITLESMSLVGDTEADYLVQVEANRALGRMVGILRKSGRIEEKGVRYPRVLSSGSVLEFRLPDDLDGNGDPFDRETGSVEWSPHVFSIERSTDGALSVYRSGTEVYAIARHVRFARFRTAAEDSSLRLKEISIDLEVEKPRETRHDVVFSLSGSAHLRN